MADDRTDTPARPSPPASPQRVEDEDGEGQEQSDAQPENGQ